MHVVDAPTRYRHVITSHRRPVAMLLKIPSVLLAVGAIALLLGPNSPASAAVQGPFWTWNSLAAPSNWCVQEYGNTSGVFLDPCSTNRSAFWSYEDPPAGNDVILATVNAHSGLCLTTMSGGKVYAAACRNYRSQSWQTGASCMHGKGKEVRVVATNDVLWQSNKALVVRGAATANVNNPHDCWYSPKVIL